MRINPILFLSLLLLLALSPLLLDWLTQGGSQWYRPYLLWLAVIIAAAWSQRGAPSDEL